MKSPRAEGGFTLVELVVGLALVSIVSVGFYSVMLSGSRGSDTARSVVRISEEARLGLNRMVRDTRQAEKITNPAADSFTIAVNFNGYNEVEGVDTQTFTYAYNATNDTITLSDGTVTEVLVKGVQRIDSKPVFSYSSNFLEFDSNADGVTDATELDNASFGDKDGVLDGAELAYVSDVSFAFRVKHGTRSTDFYGDAEMRNRR